MGGGTTPARVPPQGARAGPTTRCVGGHGREGPGDQRGRPTPVVAQEDIHAGREEGVARGAGGTAAARRDNRRLESEIEILKRARSACFTRGNVAPQKGAPAGPIASRPRCRRRHDLPGPESGGCRATPRGASVPPSGGTSGRPPGQSHRGHARHHAVLPPGAAGARRAAARVRIHVSARASAGC